ncbi:tRNA uridine-5-carboxymethylaminomethyl(34) synthesis GTPase MnmE [Sporolactobacillus spathodeae]|uniref:tRNA modification GTPase MnmE n=1 Tax=Sporolactobacillus spathodeae TaxID=1465502 RepID=A0ABS2Q4S9_9BACL|nr:tRNA uridine-5-carboxymethylaminomethyl(34) synthesis GTPase MnmE [Sporolactobacillus spathodeae]MBM7656789.1 tRNA modification GTPase [Sporolactobacillus spathodeae]
MDYDTIAAIATPLGEGAISIIRLSGPEAIATADKLFKGAKSLNDVASHTIHYGKIIDPENGREIEEAMVSVMRQPKTFTREDVVEINCHGGLVSVNRVLEKVLQQDVRLAEPGEFTKRAFLNGRIDLSQAEAVMDLIRAKSDKAIQAALGQMDGHLSRKVHELRAQLLAILAAVEVNIDYPEYDDAEVMTNRLLCEKGAVVIAQLKNLLATAKQGRILRDGLATAIIGRPNVGKSSLMNQLTHENKAIVTDIPGTTRDVIEEYVTLNGIPLKLIDTAGIRDTDDIVEKIGVSRSRAALKSADLVLFLLNASQPLDDEDRQLMAIIRDMPAIIIVNKIDLPAKLSFAEVEALAGAHPVLRLSLLNETGISALENKISELFFDEGIEKNEADYLSNPRHIALIRKAEKALVEAVNAAKSGLPVDMVQIDIQNAWNLLGEIVGETVSDQLINELFSKFCLGK